MAEVSIALTASAFIAGLLMFVAPCTLPLVPAYLAFIAGVKPSEQLKGSAQQRIIFNSLFYILGFSVVFVLLGVLVGLAGVFMGALRDVLIPVSGVLIIIFALQMLHVITLDRLFQGVQVSLPPFLTPGSPTAALVIGGAFALGWTPCVGPILASILLLAGTAGTVMGGAFLLAVFALGLAIPFFLAAVFYARLTQHLTQHQRFLRYTELVGGIFLLLIGGLLLTNNFALIITYGYQILEFFGIGNLLDYY